MKLNERRSALAPALIINLAFLALMLCCFRPIFETNDDVLISKFVDGQFSHKTAFVPFLNICLGWLLKTLYTLGGDGFQWYSLCQYLVLFLGFTAVTWTLLRRFRPFPALVMTVFMLAACGADCYLSMNFSKPAAVGTVGGLCLMLCAMENGTGRSRRLPLWLGFALCLMGFVWRAESFLLCAAILAGVGLRAMVDIAKEDSDAERKEKTRRLLGYAAPFIALAAAAGLLFGANYLAWRSEDYRDYTEFNAARWRLIDFVVPDYGEMPEVYDALDMDENAIELFRTWNFYDTEKFTTESLQTVIDARDELVRYPSPGECLGIFLDKCIRGFYENRPFAFFAFMLLLFVACGKRRGRDWLCGLWLLGMFFGVYMFFIYTDRYLANRIDMGLFLAMGAGLSFLVEPRRTEGETPLLALLLALSLFIGYRSCRSVCLLDSHNTIEDKSAEKQAVQTILEDKEHLYFVKFRSIDHELYGPLETAPAGYADRILFIGGWSCRHPEIERILDGYGIVNPYEDIIGNDRVYLIDNDIAITMAYINKYYDPDAEAEPVRPLSEETGLMIYRIVE